MYLQCEGSLSSSGLATILASSDLGMKRNFPGRNQSVTFHFANYCYYRWLRTDVFLFFVFAHVCTRRSGSQRSRKFDSSRIIARRTVRMVDRLNLSSRLCSARASHGKRFASSLMTVDQEHECAKSIHQPQSRGGEDRVGTPLPLFAIWPECPVFIGR